jgi:hypothetical protein
VAFTFEKGQTAATVNEIAKKKDLEPVEVRAIPGCTHFDSEKA